MSFKDVKKTMKEIAPKGARVIYCEHIINGEFDKELVNLYIGINIRVVVCPICGRIVLSTLRSKFECVDRIKELERLLNEKETQQYNHKQRSNLWHTLTNLWRSRATSRR